MASLIGATDFPVTDPVLICVNGIEFEAWNAPVLKPSTIALDSVQSFSASTALEELAEVDISAGLCNVDVGALSVRLRDKSSRAGFNGLDKNKFSEHCFQSLKGQPLTKGQHILVGFGCWHLELSVDRVDDPWTSILAAFHMGKYPRLGARSWVSFLNENILIVLSRLFWKEGACQTTLIGPGSKLLFNYWNNTQYESKRSAEGVVGMGFFEEVRMSGGPERYSPQLRNSSSPGTYNTYAKPMAISGSPSLAFPAALVSHSYGTTPATRCSATTSSGINVKARSLAPLSLPTSPAIAFSAVSFSPAHDHSASPSICYSGIPSSGVHVELPPYSGLYASYASAPTSNGALRAAIYSSPPAGYLATPCTSPHTGFSAATDCQAVGRQSGN